MYVNNIRPFWGSIIEHGRWCTVATVNTTYTRIMASLLMVVVEWISVFFFLIRKQTEQTNTEKGGIAV